MNQYKIEELGIIVAKLSEKYTSKESTSITYQKAQQLMGAVLYCIKEYEDCRDIKWEQEHSIRKVITAQEAYDKGYQKVLEKVNMVVRIYGELSDSFCSYGNLNYYDTFIEGISGFLKYYDPRFYPQNHIIGMDYPTLVERKDLSGVDAIFRYIQDIKLEQLFLNSCSPTYVQEVLTAYHKDYQGLYINICSVVLRNMLGCMMGEMKQGMAECTKEEYEQMKKFVQNHSKKRLKDLVEKMIWTIVQQKFGGSVTLYEYLSADVNNFIVEMKNAVTNDCLGSVCSFHIIL